MIGNEAGGQAVISALMPGESSTTAAVVSRRGANHMKPREWAWLGRGAYHVICSMGGVGGGQVEG